MAYKSSYFASAAYAKESNEILFNKGKTFYWAKFFLSKNAAQQATRLYRFCRYIDDIADETHDKNQAIACLNSIKTQLKIGESNDAVITDAIALFEECKIPILVPTELINGVLADLDFVRIKTEAQLLAYCYQVAGTVGIMMCKVLNVSCSNALYHAIDLGIGMQLTNICRDVYADALMDRVYLPESMTGPITPDEVIKLDDMNRTKLIQAITLLLKKADRYYASGYSGLVKLPIRSRISILIAAKLYQQIGVKIQRTRFENFKIKAFIPFQMKLLISINECFKALIDPKFWAYRSFHNKMLHQSIAKLPFCNG